MSQYKVFTILIQVILWSHIGVAGFERRGQPVSVIAGAFSGAGVASNDNLWINPASLPSSHEFHRSLFYTPSMFGLKQLAQYGLLISNGYSSFSLAMGIQSFGFPLYRETLGSMNGAYHLDEDITVGAAFHLYHLSIQRYGSAAKGVIDLGVRYSLSETITVGSSLQNITGSSFTDGDDIPQKIISGIGVELSELAMLTADVVKDLRYPLTYVGSVRVLPTEHFSVQIGWDGGTSSMTGGIGIILSPMQFNYAVISHSILGLTHSIGVSF